MQDLASLALVLVMCGGVAVFAAGAMNGSERPVWLWPMVGTWVITAWMLRRAARLTGAGLLYAATTAGPRFFGGLRRVKDPATAELVERIAVNPARTPRVEQLANGYHWTPAGLMVGAHKVTIAQPGAGKNQACVNFEVQHQLQHSPEHLILLEVKPLKPLTRIVASYARPEDRVWIYTMQPHNPSSSALALSEYREVRDFAFMICNDPKAKDPHWNSKATALISQASLAISRYKGHDPRDSERVSSRLFEVADVVADREALDGLRESYRNVDNVADEPKEWGYIRSTATGHMDALTDARVRRVFAGNDRTPQPLFTGYPDGGRDIVIVRPHEPSAKREAKYVVGMLDILLQRAVAAGYAGGAGVKVVLDEFASFLDMAQMSSYIDLGREAKVSISYVLQGLNQLYARMDETVAKAMFDNTDIKVVGATGDRDLGERISANSGEETVDHPGVRQRGNWLRDMAQSTRPRITPTDITGQRKGDWTVVVGPDIYRRRVEKHHTYDTQAAPPQPIKLRGVVKPEVYAPPTT